MNSPASIRRPATSGFNPFRAIFNLFDSIWLGIFLIAAILIYAAVGSAVPMFRQTFELTEFAYFNHWVFAALILLFCICLSVTTVRRIPFNLRNAGVLTVHTGLLTLCAGSVMYFGRKIEGDLWLDAPRIRVVSADRLKSNPEQAVLANFVAVKGKTWETSMPMLGGNYRVQVADVRHEGMTTASSVKLVVQVADEPPRDIELTQTQNPQSRFAKLNDRVLLALTPARVTDTFFDDTTPVLKVSHDEHVESFALPMLPYYSERFVADVEPLKDLDGKEVTSGRMTPIEILEKWRMPISLDDPNRSMSADWPLRMEIDGYLPYARLESDAVPGGTETTPIADVRLTKSGESIDQWLVAQMPARSMMEMPKGPRVEFAWLADMTDLGPAYTRTLPGSQVLSVHVKDKKFKRDYVITPGMVINVEGTPYKLTVEQLQPSWPLMTAEYKDARTPIALIWVESPTGKFQRSVLQRFPHLDQDRDRAGKKMSDKTALVDDNLELFYTDASTDHFMIVAGEKLAPTLIHTAVGGQRKMQVIKPGATYQASPDLSVTLTNFIEKPLFVAKPTIIPARNRRSLGDVKRNESLIRVKLASRDGTWNKHVWVPFSHYNNSTLIDTQEPTVVNNVPGLGALQLLYGREERPLPGRVTLEQLKTDFYPGRQQPSEWTSYFRFEDAATHQVRLAKAFLNNTARIGNWTLFQSQASGDHESWTVLGVGNREGVLTMLAGCTLIALGMIFAFAIKPIIVRRRKQRIESEARARHEGTDARVHEEESARRPVSTVASFVLLIALGWLAPQTARATEGSQSEIAPASDLAGVQKQIDLKTLGALVLQHQWRYATVDSWSRDAIKTLYGRSSLWNLDPIAAAMEMMFNGPAYHAEPIIYVKDKALLKDMTAYPVKVSDDQRRAIFESGRVSYDFLRMPEVTARVEQLAGDMLKKKSMDRLSSAVGNYEGMSSTFTIVPNPRGQKDSPWSSPAAVMDPSTRESTGLDAQQSAELSTAVVQFGKAWRARNVDAINAQITKLNQLLPSLAPSGVYLPLEKREAEVTYRRMNLLWWAWLVYIFAFFISIYAVATGYGWVRTLGLTFLISAIALHGADIGLRWYVIGRIPVANMYEAIVSSAFSGAMFALLLELFLRKRVYLLAAALLGFFSLALPELLPDKVDNKLMTMMPILDDIMLRIHTVLIISSYAVITLAYGVANCYLFVSAKRNREPAAIAAIGAQVGAILCLFLAKFGLLGDSETGFLSAIIPSIAGGALLALGIGSLRSKPSLIPALAGAGGGTFSPVDLAGLNSTTPSAERNPQSAIRNSQWAQDARSDLLQEFDLSQRVLLYTAMVALFVGLVLGAIWADYSWGRPWGWDPKEVFALNTWLVYAILVHVRFVTKKRALWTSILSVVGFAAMQFNWWVVNFYIVGLHSYA